MQIPARTTREPRTGTPKAITAKPTSSATSTIRKVSRDRTNDARNWGRDIGVAVSRLSRCFRRASTIANPNPQMPLPMRFMPSRPGTTKST